MNKIKEKVYGINNEIAISQLDLAIKYICDTDVQASENKITNSYLRKNAKSDFYNFLKNDCSLDNVNKHLDFYRISKIKYKKMPSELLKIKDFLKNIKSKLEKCKTNTL
jgi:uncharacterized protein YwqG